MSDEKLSESVMQEVRSGRTIQAIKQLRMETGLGLKEAKAIIDRETNAYKLAKPRAPIAPESTPWPKVIVFVLIALALYWYLTKAA